MLISFSLIPIACGNQTSDTLVKALDQSGLVTIMKCGEQMSQARVINSYLPTTLLDWAIPLVRENPATLPSETAVENQEVFVREAHYFLFFLSHWCNQNIEGKTRE